GASRMANRVKHLERPSPDMPDVERISGWTAADESTALPPIPVLKRQRRSRRPLVLAVVLLAVVVVGALDRYHLVTDGRFMVWTDDAYVGAKTATLAAKVPGHIASLNVADNAPVQAGDIIATIDEGDYKLAVEAARGKINTQQATIDRLGRQIAALEAQ